MKYGMSFLAGTRDECDRCMGVIASDGQMNDEDGDGDWWPSSLC